MAKLVYRRDSGEEVIILAGSKDACEAERDKLLEFEGEMGFFFHERYRVEEE